MKEEAACGCCGGESGKKTMRLAVIASGVAAGLGLLLEQAGVEIAAGAAFAAAVAAGGSLIVPKAWRALLRRAFDMNVLMTLAVAGALAIGEWAEAAAVTFLFALSELLEAASLERARHAVRALMKLAPETALLIPPGGEGAAPPLPPREVPVEAVPVGACVVVRSGSRIPLDGVIVSGRSTVDQAPITGESIPVGKAPGDEVFAGTINGEGALEIRTTRPSGETTLARIVHLVEEAQARKAPTQRFIDRFAAAYTPAVLAGALLVAALPPLFLGGGAAVWADWFYRSLVLLVIACPCALVIATPVSIVSGLTAMARRGVLIKGGAALEAIGRLKALAVDKTGTITAGKPTVAQVVPMGAASEEEILRVAAAIDVHSPHPIAQAVVAHARERGIAFPRGANYRAWGGQGAQAEVGGHPYFVGNHRFTHEMAVCTPEIERELAALEAAAHSVVVVGHRPPPDGGAGCGCRGEVLGILAVRDALRPEAPAALAALHRLGVRPVVMLSGDNSRTVAAIARQAGIDDAYGDLLPERKTECLHALIAEHGAVGMIGDGVNDAPALAAATVGIAMGQGTDTALETADIALMHDDLGKVAEAIALGRRTMRIIRANIVFALVVKALFLLLALTGHASLWAAIAADTGATLLVVANALRLLRAGRRENQPFLPIQNGPVWGR